jgi:hypothetical protein
VLYEADTDAIAAIQVAGKDRPGQLIVIPACPADRDGDGLLHIYVNPGLTSLRELSREIFEGLRGSDAAYLRQLKRYERRPDSEFEALLRRHGLADFASKVKRKRRSQARNMRWVILKSQGHAPRCRAMAKQGANAIRRAVLRK